MGIFDAGSVSQIEEFPDWLTDAAQDSVNLASKAANQPYEAYPRARLAPFTARQNRGFRKIDAAVDDWRPDLARAGGALSSAGGALRDVGRVGDSRFTDPGVAEAYMNPFVDEVVDTSLRRYDEDAARARNDLSDRRVATGSFGGGRHGVAEAEFDRGSAEDRARINAGLMSDAYNSAAGIYTSDQGRALDAYSTQADGYQDVARGYGALAGDRQALAYGDADALLRAGGAEQGLKQAGLDIGYGDFLEQRDWPIRGVNIYSGALSSTPVGSTRTETVEPNTAGQIGGALTTGLGILDNVGGLDGVGDFFSSFF